jgi:hypothetical protein
MRHPGGIPIALAEWEGLMESYALLIAATLNAGTVLAIAALGLLINEKVGVVNLGAEGMMLCAAIAGFAAVVHTGSDMLGFLGRHGSWRLARCHFWGHGDLPWHQSVRHRLGIEFVWGGLFSLCGHYVRARKTAPAASV